MSIDLIVTALSFFTTRTRRPLAEKLKRVLNNKQYLNKNIAPDILMIGLLIAFAN